jgi:hypothetical protein
LPDRSKAERQRQDSHHIDPDFVLHLTASITLTVLSRENKKRKPPAVFAF